MKKSLTDLDLNLLLCLQLLMRSAASLKLKRMGRNALCGRQSLAKLRAWFDDRCSSIRRWAWRGIPLMVGMEQNLADWMQMGNQLLDNRIIKRHAV